MTIELKKLPDNIAKVVITSLSGRINKLSEQIKNIKNDLGMD